MHLDTLMFEYVKDREQEEKRKMTIYSVIFAIAIVAVLAAIFFGYR